MDHLVLVSNCHKPDLLVSLVISSLLRKCIELENGHYSAAFFSLSDVRADNTRLDKYPVKQMSLVIPDTGSESDLQPSMASSETNTSIISVMLFVIMVSVMQ